MTALKPTIVLMAAMLSASSLGSRAESADPASPRCEARLVSGPTAFPVGASGTRRGGTVALEVDVGADGTVMDAMVVDSSGSRVLDRAAVDSARSHWKFAAQECSDNARLSHSYIVVHFRTKPAYTFSAMRAPEYRREVHDASAPGCTMSTGSGETVVVSCIVDGESHTRIAER